ncbi:TAXI family TRAP transporter solute-binding subunit [Niveispirillum lacus]|uniref:TAXI family TRAP transporter solute-binding subunit n=1 Tax=Niveispirillum lacus TaxID=1981099 RepID=UPI000B961740|nr:TAXI family TRAP transporter solute-binding subunit [Niveispirillum lacus]
MTFHAFPSLAAALTLSVLLAVPSMAQQPQPGPKTVLVASGTVTGLYYPVAGALCRQMNQERPRHGLRCLVEATDGPVQNLAALRSGDVDLALIQSDWQAVAVRGEGRFSGTGPFKELRAVATLHAETITLLVRPEAEIDDLSKLKGKRVNLGPRGSALRNLSDLVIGAAGVRLPDDADMAPDVALAALCAGQLDAAFFAVGHPNASVMQATVQCGAVPLAVAGPGIDKLLSQRPDLTPADIPANLYPGVQEAVSSIGVAATLVTRADVPDETIREVVRVLLEERSELVEQHPVFNGLTRDTMADRARTAPPHPAAAAAFAATGPIQR